jgi:hypothetical protein
MGRIIRLTERDLTRLVKRTITELDRSTYDSAADVAGEKGYNKLSDRFREHGKEFGLNQEKDNITMVVKRAGEEVPIDLRLIGLKKEPNISNAYTLETEDLDKGLKRDFEINLNMNTITIEFFLMGNYPSLPATRKDARKALRFFEDNGFSVSNIDPRSISYDDTGF